MMDGRKVAVLCIGSEVYGVGSVIKVLADVVPGILFVAFKRGHLTDWLTEKGARLRIVDGLAEFTASGSFGTLSRLPQAVAAAHRTARNLIPLLEAEHIGIVHTHWLPQQLTGLFLRRRGIKVLWHIHNNMDRRRLFGVGQKLNHLFARLGADMLVPVSAFIGGNWRKAALPSRVVWNCAYPLYPSSNTLQDPAIRCLIAGRLQSSKGHHIAVEAVRIAREAGVECRLDIYGGPLENNPYADQLRSSIERNGLAELITLKGFANDIRNQHQQYHFGLQCRIDPEPCSVWVCETLVDGLPLIASETGGTPELIEDGVCGRLVPAGDAQALASEMISLAKNPQRLRAMREAAFDRGRKKFLPERFRNDILAAYAAVGP